MPLSVLPAPAPALRSVLAAQAAAAVQVAMGANAPFVFGRELLPALRHRLAPGGQLLGSTA